MPTGRIGGWCMPKTVDTCTAAMFHQTASTCCSRATCTVQSKRLLEPLFPWNLCFLRAPSAPSILLSITYLLIIWGERLFHPPPRPYLYVITSPTHTLRGVLFRWNVRTLSTASANPPGVLSMVYPVPRNSKHSGFALWFRKTRVMGRRRARRRLFTLKGR